MLKNSFTTVLIIGAMFASNAMAERAANSDAGGIYTGTYYTMKAKLTVRKGRFLNQTNVPPYPVNNANVKVETDCVLRIDGYDATTLGYGHTLICNGLNGWEIADFTGKGSSFHEIADGFGSIAHDWADLYMGSKDASFWTETAWWGDDYFQIEYNGREQFTAVLDKAGILKKVKVDGFKDGMLWLNDERGSNSWFASLKSNLQIKYVPIAKLDPAAAACFSAWDDDAEGVNPPCDPD